MTEPADQRICINAPAHSTSLVQAFFKAKNGITQVCLPSLQPKFDSLQLLAFPRATITVEREEICKCDSHAVHKLSQRRLTADWLAQRESDRLRMRSKVSSGWMPSYIKAMRPVLEILKMDWYFPDSPRKCHIERIRLQIHAEPYVGLHAQRPSLCLSLTTTVICPQALVKLINICTFIFYIPCITVH